MDNYFQRQCKIIVNVVQLYIYINVISIVLRRHICHRLLIIKEIVYKSILFTLFSHPYLALL